MTGTPYPTPQPPCPDGPRSAGPDAPGAAAQESTSQNTAPTAAGPLTAAGAMPKPRPPAPGEATSDIDESTVTYSLARPVVATGRWGRALYGWSHRPAGRFVVAVLAVATALALAGSAGAYVVPAAAPQVPKAPTPAATRSAPPGEAAPGYDLNGSPLPYSDPQQSMSLLPPGVTPPGGRGTTDNPSDSGTPPATVTQGRSVDGLAAWALRLSRPLDIPVTALKAYGYAELVMAQAQPGCKLRWTTLAGIGKIESDHGRANHAVLGANGLALPSILGPVLDGTNNTTRIADTDQGQLDGDTTYDRAVGPMQFIPSTWRIWGVDADADASINPNDINDAALAAARYLCSGGRDLSTAADWWGAILSYNQVAAYARDVFDTANRYGTYSRNIN